MCVLEEFFPVHIVLSNGANCNVFLLESDLFLLFRLLLWLNKPSSFILSTEWHMLQPHDHLGSLDLLHYVNGFLVVESPKWDTLLHMKSHKC